MNIEAAEYAEHRSLPETVKDRYAALPEHERVQETLDEINAQIEQIENQKRSSLILAGKSIAVAKGRTNMTIDVENLEAVKHAKPIFIDDDSDALGSAEYAANQAALVAPLSGQLSEAGKRGLSLNDGAVRRIFDTKFKHTGPNPRYFSGAVNTPYSNEFVASNLLRYQTIEPTAYNEPRSAAVAQSQALKTDRVDLRRPILMHNYAKAEPIVEDGVTSKKRTKRGRKKRAKPPP
jgi:hypothetical protein